MSWTERLRAFVAGVPTPIDPLPPRHARREAARLRHEETGEPEWTESDRHLGPPGTCEVADLSPLWAGEQASHRTVRDD